MHWFRLTTYSVFTRFQNLFVGNTLGPAYNEYPVIRSRLLCIKLIDCNVKKFSYNEHPLITRLHSSRMRTVRLLPISPSMYCTGGCLVPGVAWSRGVSAPGGPASGAGGGCIPACNGPDPPVNRITEKGKNITLSQLRCGR